MSTEINQTVAPAAQGAGEGQPVEKIELSKTEYEELVGLKATTGSLKRDLKDAQKALEEFKKPKDTPQQNQSDNSGLVHKTYLRAAGITAEDEVELALSTAKKWGVEIDKVVDDEDFKVKLERLRTTKSNELATSRIQGGSGGGAQAKNEPSYWIAKGVPPTPDQVPDRKVRAKIVRAMIDSEKGIGGDPYYNGKK